MRVLTPSELGDILKRAGVPENSAMKKKKPAGPAGLREPGFWETIKEVFLGVRRPFDCIQVEVSSRCPGRCTYCPRHLRRESWRGRDMEMAAFERLWPLLRRAGRVHLQGWGEPLLNPAFADMVALGRRAGCAVSTTTCGLIMDEPLARRIVDGGMDIVAFSLAGTDAAGNSARAGVPFERVCAAVELLQTVRRRRMGVHLEIHIAYLMLASAMEAVRALPALMQRLGLHAAVVSTLDYPPQAQLAAEGIGPGDAVKLARAAAILAETAAEAQRLGLGFHYALPAPDAPGTECRENIGRSLFVSADGGVSPCVYLNVPDGAEDPARRVFGNINGEDPLAIWERVDFRRFREDLAAGCPDRPCQSCPKRY
jgi:MoaA/NifB/PqqE/SkfB family radical SAM enzyme